MSAINLRGISTKKLIPLLVAIILLAVFVPQHFARAGWLDFVFSDSTLGSIINGITTLMLNFIQKAISLFAGLFDQFIQYQTNNAVYGVLVVDQSWTIIRNFVNMLFILILIIMAFGTIFNIQKYTWKEMLAPFLIAALLVNFSLTIGQYIITIANGLSSVFLKEVGAVSGTFAQGFSLVSISTSGSTNLVSGAGEVVVTAIFAIIFLSIVMLAFAAAAIFSLVRIFILWFLLIISPIAWIGYSLPNLRGQTWGEWWKQFFCWCFFLPYYLFFVMFAVIFIKNRSTIPPVPGSEATAGLSGTNLLFYSLSLIFLIGGLAVARKMACASGTGVGTVFGKIEGGVKKYMPGSRYVRAIGAGAKGTVERVKEEGLPGLGALYEGTQAEKQRGARIGERIQTALGFRPTFAAQKEFSERANKEFGYIKQQYDLGQIDIKAIQNGARESASKPKGYANRKMLAEMGQLDPVTARETILALRDNPYTAADFAKTASKAKWSAVPSGDILQMAAAKGAYTDLGTSNNYLPARREMYKYIQANPRVAADITDDQFKTGIEIFGGPTTADGSSYLNDIAKARPDFVANYNIAHPIPGAKEKKREQIMAGFLTNTQDIGNIPVVVWEDPDFKSVISERFKTSFATGNRFKSALERFVAESGKNVLEKNAKIKELWEKAYPKKVEETRP